MIFKDFDEDEPVLAKLPWVGNDPWEGPGPLGHPKVVIPGAPGPDDDLPCVGRWDLFDTETVTDEHRALCGGCPFQDWCRQTASANNEWWIWGATSYEDRKHARKEEEAA